MSYCCTRCGGTGFLNIHQLPGRTTVPLTERAQQEVEQMIAELDLPRKRVLAEAAAIASEAITELLASALVGERLKEARRRVEHLEGVLGGTAAENGAPDD